MKIVSVLLVLACFGLSEPSPNPIVGTWELFSYADTSSAEQVYFPFGTLPNGQFVFTADGHFSAESNPNDGTIPANLPVPGFNDQTRPYMGYFGTYQFDQSTGEVSFNVAGSSAPGYVGSTVSSHVRFDGDHMIMTGSSIRRNGEDWTWERMLTRQ